MMSDRFTPILNETLERFTFILDEEQITGEYHRVDGITLVFKISESIVRHVISRGESEQTQQNLPES
jgi:hypothetical protein